MSGRTRFQNDAFGRAQLIRKHEVTLQVVSGEPSDMPGLNVTGLPGGGGWYNMVSVEMALELGLTIRECDYRELRAGPDDIPLRVVGEAKLKICCHGICGAGLQWIPYWTDIEVFVLSALQGRVGRDLLLSWDAQNKLHLIINNNENSEGLLRY